MKRSFSYFSFFFLLSIFMFSQQYQSVSDSIIKNAIKLRAEKKFDESLKELDKISNLSTYYQEALFEKAAVYYHKEDYKESLKILENIEIDSKNNRNQLHNYYNSLGNSYSSDKQKEKAVQTYDQALIEFPNSYILQYNKGYTLLDLNKDKEAAECLKKVIEINPYYTKAHALLGAIALDNGNLTEGTLALTTATLLQPEASFTAENLSLLDKVLSKKYESPENSFTISDKEEFEIIENILQKQFALNNQYKINSEIVLPVTKQLHALISELSKDKVSDGFFNQTYVSLMQKIGEDKQFENMIYYMFSGINNESVQKIIRKKTNNIKQFKEWLVNNILTLGKRSSETNGKREEETRIVFGNMIGFGKIEKLKKQGKWTFRYETGIVGFETMFIDDKPESKAFSYDENGKLVNESFYLNGKQERKEMRYYDNGRLKDESEYKDGIETNKINTYYYSGGLNCTISVKDGIKSGEEICYYPNGNKKNIANYSKGILNGEYLSFYPNNELKIKANVIDGYYTGLKIDYNPNKTPEFLENYVNGVYEGEQKYFAANGELFGKMINQKGKILKSEFYFGKSILEENSYKNDKLDKSKVFFNDKPVLELNYNGQSYFQNYTIWNEKEEIVSKNKISLSTAFQIVLANGENYIKGKFNKKGEKDGEWTEYETGNIDNKTNYLNGKKEGLYSEYFSNGKIKREINFKDDKKEGETKSYYINGKLETKGNYSNDKAEGECFYYNESGILKANYFLENDILNGIYLDYAVDGKLYKKSIYKNGTIEKETLYTPDGKEVYTLDYTTEGKKNVKGINGGEIIDFGAKNGEREGEYIIKDKNNQIIFKAVYTNGKIYGESTSYHPNGVLSSKATRFDGDYEGFLFQYDLNGNLISEAEYHKGSLFGVLKRYFNNSTIYFETEYHNNKKHGILNYYGTNGELILKLHYYNDVLTGYQKQDNQGSSEIIPVKQNSAHIIGNYKSGKKAYDITYKQGNLDGDYLVYNEEGKEMIRTQYKDGFITGIRASNRLNGKPYIYEEFLDGNLNGKTIVYDEDGRKKIEVNYLRDYRNGDFILYDKSGKIKSTKTYYNGDLIKIK